MDNNFRILVVDDEEDICSILRFNLEKQGYAVDVSFSAEEALNLPLQNYKLILLDVMMCEISGFRFAEILQSSTLTKSIPIIFITAKDTESDLISGFNLGADDYISKPFSIKEVLLRVKAVLRRNMQPILNDDLLIYEGIIISQYNKSVSVDGTKIPFTKTEFEILSLFISNINRVFSREEILNKVWHDDIYVLDRTVDVNIARVRKKIGKYSSCLISRQGYGYIFNG